MPETLKTIDTHTGETFRYTETRVHEPSKLRVPAYVTKRTCTLLRPSQVLPCLLASLNPGASRSYLRDWKARVDD